MVDSPGYSKMPKAYDIDNPDEVARLHRECFGYLHASRRSGTDREGRQFAMDALDALWNRWDAATTDAGPSETSRQNADTQTG